ncbi:hypothetical protein B0H13DRAFT_2659915 [Mycena leptocephala]|nr:hypothetical protein B0H13DRAFT_2659915 [Mycena leptocephala]
MLFRNKFAIIVVTSVTTIFQGIDLCAWPSTQACSGIALCCFNLAKNGCCANLPSNVGFSISYNPLPSSIAFGQAWTQPACTDPGGIGTNQIGPGDRCWNGQGVKANSMSWANSGDRRRFDGNITETVSLNAFVFTNNGVEKAIRIPEHSGAVDTLFELYQKGDFATLEGYETIERSVCPYYATEKIEDAARRQPPIDSSRPHGQIQY